MGRTILRRLVDEAPADLLATQLVHGDFRSANILCTGAGIAAVLDFEEARLDHCVDELARSAVMLGTRFRDWGPVTSDVRARFREGYESVRRLTAVEASWWDILVLWYSLVLLPPDALRASPAAVDPRSPHAEASSAATMPTDVMTDPS